MTVLVVLLGAVGLALVVTGLPPLRQPNVADRVAPYLPGAPLFRRGTSTTLLHRLAAHVPGSAKDVSTRLDAAGSSLSTLAFRAEQIAWSFVALGVSAGATIIAAASGVAIDPSSTPLLAVICGLGGYYGRDWWLGKQVQMRGAALKEELPTAIDLMALALIAGESPSVAMDRVAGSIRGTVGGEFSRILADARAGETFLDAVLKGKERTSDPATARFLDALATGIEKGSPLADILRAQADDIRHARGRELVEGAGRREVLMLVPVVFLIMPVVVVYALFPGLASLDLFVK